MYIYYYFPLVVVLIVVGYLTLLLCLVCIVCDNEVSHREKWICITYTMVAAAWWLVNWALVRVRLVHFWETSQYRFSGYNYSKLIYQKNRSILRISQTQSIQNQEPINISPHLIIHRTATILLLCSFLIFLFKQCC